MLRVNFYATLRSIIGKKTLEFDLPDGSNIHTILGELFKLHPELKSEILDAEGKIQEYVTLFISGRDIRYLEGMESTLSSEKVLDIFPPVAGG
ncbi:MAG: ubiquitin-like small modifier protein 1 [Deinococcales bacterium]